MTCNAPVLCVLLNWTLVTIVTDRLREITVLCEMCKFQKMYK